MKTCKKIDDCMKIDIIMDKDILNFQAAEAIREVCSKCEEYTTGEEIGEFERRIRERKGRIGDIYYKDVLDIIDEARKEIPLFGFVCGDTFDWEEKTKNWFKKWFGK